MTVTPEYIANQVALADLADDIRHAAKLANELLGEFDARRNDRVSSGNATVEELLDVDQQLRFNTRIGRMKSALTDLRHRTESMHLGV